MFLRLSMVTLAFCVLQRVSFEREDLPFSVGRDKAAGRSRRAQMPETLRFFRPASSS